MFYTTKQRIWHFHALHFDTMCYSGRRWFNSVQYAVHVLHGYSALCCLCLHQKGTLCSMLSLIYTRGERNWYGAVCCPCFTLWYRALCCLCFTLERKEFDIVQCAIHVLNFDTVHCAVFVLHKEENVTHCTVCCQFDTVQNAVHVFFYTTEERIWHSAVCCPCLHFDTEHCAFYVLH